MAVVPRSPHTWCRSPPVHVEVVNLKGASQIVLGVLALGGVVAAESALVGAVLEQPVSIGLVDLDDLSPIDGDRSPAHMERLSVREVERPSTPAGTHASLGVSSFGLRKGSQLAGVVRQPGGLGRAGSAVAAQLARQGS